MFPSVSRKRNRDTSDDVDFPSHEKKSRYSAAAGHGQEHNPPTSAPFSATTSPALASDLMFSGEENSISSTVSEASSSDMDMDTDAPSDFGTVSSRSPEQPSSSWTLRPSHLRNPRMAIDDRGHRIPTPISAAIRPQPMPVQVPNNSFTHSLPTMMTRGHLGYAVERFPSPISEDEPHTPTTAAGSQLSLLTVTDVDMDMDLPEPTPPPPQPEPITVRKQRQRSGAFTSPREPSKRLIMGYREDCEKCRNRVPGHMNHFMGR